MFGDNKSYTRVISVVSVRDGEDLRPCRRFTACLVECIPAAASQAGVCITPFIIIHIPIYTVYIGIGYKGIHTAQAGL